MTRADSGARFMKNLMIIVTTRVASWHFEMPRGQTVKSEEGER